MCSKWKRADAKVEENCFIPVGGKSQSNAVTLMWVPHGCNFSVVLFSPVGVKRYWNSVGELFKVLGKAESSFR